MIKDAAQSLTTTRKQSLPSILSYFAFTGPQSKLLHHFFFHLSQLQYIALLIKLQLGILDPMENEPLTHFFDKLSGILSLAFLFEGNTQGTTYSAILIITWVYLLVILGICLLCSIRAIKVLHNGLKTDSKPLHPILQFHFAILFCVANVILILPLSPKNADKSIETAIEIGFSGLTILNLIVIIINCVLAGFLAYFCISPFRSSNPFSTRTPAFQVVTFIAKTAVSLLLPFAEKDNQGIQILLLMIILILAMIKIFFLFSKMPYYHSTGMKASIVWSSVTLCLGIILIFAVLFCSNSIKGNRLTVIYLDMLLIPILVKLALFKLDKDIKSFMKIELNGLTSEEQAMKKLLSTEITGDNAKLAMSNNEEFNFYDMCLMGDLAEHSKTCGDNACLCVLIRSNGEIMPSKSLGDFKNKVERYLGKQESRFLRSSINRLRNNEELKIALAHLIVSRDGDKITRALVNLFSISRKKSSFWTNIKKEILLQQVQRKLNKHFLLKENGALDVRSFIDFHTDRENFVGLMLANTKAYIDFWMHYKQNSFELVQLIKKSVDIENKADKIESLWNSYIKKYPAFYGQVKGVYCMYLALIRNTPCFADKLSKKSYLDNAKAEENMNGQKKNDIITEQSLVLADTVVFKVAMYKEQLGRIQYVSENVKSVLNYTQGELLGKTIAALMTPLLASKHDSILIKHLEKGQMEGRKVYHKNIMSYAKSNKGYIHPCAIHITISPYLQNNVTYFGALRILKSPDDIILITHEGVIEGFTENIGRILNLDTSTPTFIKDICPNINEQVIEAPVILAKRTSRILARSLDEDTSKEYNQERTGGVASIAWSHKKLDVSKIWPQDAEENEIKIQNLTFVKQKRFGAQDKEDSVNIDIELKLEMMMGSKLYVMKLKLINEQLTKTKTDIKTQEGISEKSVDDVADEREDPGEKEPVIPESPILPNYTQYPKKFSRVNLFSHRTNLLSEGNLSSQQQIFSPKLAPTEMSQGDFDYLETNHNLLKGSISPGLKPTMESLSSPKRKSFPRKQVRELTQITRVISEKSSHFEMKKENRKDNSDLGTNGLASIGLRSKVEEAVYITPSSKLINYTKLAIKAFIVMCVGFLIGLTIYSQQQLSYIEADTKILTISSLRLYRVIETRRVAEAMYMLKAGTYTENRYTHYGLPPFRTILLGSFTNAVTNLNGINGKLRISLNETESELHRNFYNQLVPMVSNDSSKLSTRYSNTFDAATDIVDRASKIIASYPLVLTVPDFESLEFIRRNTFNEMILTSEGISQTTVQDAHIKFDELTTLTLSIMVFFLVFGCLIIGLLIWQQVKMIQNRDKFVDIFLRIDENQINIALNRIRQFETSLSLFYVKSQDFNLQDGLVWGPERSKKENTQGSLVRRKATDTTGINYKQGIILVLSILMFGLVMVPFLHMYILSITKSKTYNSKLSTMVEVNTGMYESILMSVSFYVYIMSPANTTLRGKPIGEEWEAIYQKRANAQRYLADLLISNEVEDDGCSEDTMNTLSLLLKGDLCSVLPPEKIQFVCPLLSGGLLRKGIQFVNTFMLTAFREAKDEFDGSSRTWDAARDILSKNEMKDLDLMMARWYYSAFVMLGNIFESCTSEVIQNYQEVLRVYLGVYIAVCVSGAAVMMVFWRKLVEDDRSAWRKMFRKIPAQIVNSNKLLKNYLMRENRSILHNIEA